DLRPLKFGAHCVDDFLLAPRKLTHAETSLSGTTLPALAALAIARAASRFRSTAVVYRSISLSVRWPETAPISCGLQSFSAMIRHPAFRRPCGTQDFGSPASSQRCRNHRPNDCLANGRPHSLVRKVSASDELEQASIAAKSSGATGTSTFTGFRLRFFSWV